MPQLNMESKPDCHVAPSRIPRSMDGVDENLCAHSLLGAYHRKFQSRVRHIPISPPYIGRRGCGVRLPQSLRDMGDSINKPIVVPTAGPGRRRNGESVSEHAVRSVRARGESGTGRPEGADHKNRGSVGKPAGGLLEVRAPVGRDLEAKLPAVDKSRATETARLDHLAFPAGSHDTAPPDADFSAHYAAPARSQRSHGPGLVHETHSGGSAARSRRRGAEVD